MSGFMEFYFLRMLYVGLVVIGLAIVGSVVYVLLRRAGKLEAAKKTVGPVARAVLRSWTEGRRR